MGTRDSYAEGTFCWVDLVTTDVDEARRFYGGLFGWDAPDGEQYTHWTLEGRDVAGVYTLPDVEPAWAGYVAVADADGTAARAAALGGSVEERPHDTSGAAGRRAVIADPIGARVALWQAGTRPGAGLVNDVGCWCANQLQAHDPAPAIPFYRDVFGWEVVEDEESEPPYWDVRVHGSENGSLIGGEQGPPAWLVYFHVADVEAATRAAMDGGGAVHFPPTAIAIGSIAVCADPQGAAFGVFAGATDP
jgi:uncharacterized protein